MFYLFYNSEFMLYIDFYMIFLKMFLGITEHNWLDVKVCLETSQEDKIIQKTAHEIFDRYIYYFTIVINYSNVSPIYFRM